MMHEFSTDYAEILERIETINPIKYSGSRNYIDGAVTYLSPYISRGVISTKQVYQSLFDRGFEPTQIEKLVQELAWRDYWQQVWVHKKEEINQDLRHAQPDVAHYQISKIILEAQTGINAIDQAILKFYENGYLHNHVRMYIAFLACNAGKAHWLLPAKWMYFHLLDGDWASNALSWQWVAGSNANKKYVANQENINKYCHTVQKNTFLDMPYENLEFSAAPNELKVLYSLVLQTKLPKFESIHINNELPILLYNYYNLDPLWQKDATVNRILLLEPSIFEKYPVGENAINFCLALAENISDLQVFVGEYKALKQLYPKAVFEFKEHPLNSYEGKVHQRDWMFPVEGYFPSFFGFWKKCKKHFRPK